MADRQGVEIDYCPQCRGVWLDRGELDKLLERSSQELRPRYDDDDDDDRRRYDRPRHDQPAWGHGKKRKNFLSEIFEFGD